VGGASARGAASDSPVGSIETAASSRTSVMTSRPRVGWSASFEVLSELFVVKAQDHLIGTTERIKALWRVQPVRDRERKDQEAISRNRAADVERAVDLDLFADGGVPLSPRKVTRTWYHRSSIRSRTRRLLVPAATAAYVIRQRVSLGDWADAQLQRHCASGRNSSSCLRGLSPNPCLRPGHPYGLLLESGGPDAGRSCLASRLHKRYRDVRGGDLYSEPACCG
jgi:hypothetical protein